MSRGLVGLAVALAALVATRRPRRPLRRPAVIGRSSTRTAFSHYACKQRLEATTGGLKTATRYNKSAPRDVGVYAALARGSNRNLAAERTSNDRDNGWIRLLIRGARESDRLWMQAAAYGPAAPWSDGFPVRRIVRCASVA